MRVDAADAERPAAGVRGVAHLFGERIAVGFASAADDRHLELGAIVAIVIALGPRRRIDAVTKPVLDRAQILHVAELASLSLTDEETNAMATELAAIVSFMGDLDAVDTDDVPPTAHVQLERAAWRRDAVEPSLSQAEALSQAPESAHGGFAVPVFVES